MMTPRPERCDGCRFWARNLAQAGYGECRRHSPVIVPNRDVGNLSEMYTGHWPTVKESDWCGEFIPLYDLPLPPMPPLPTL